MMRDCGCKAILSSLAWTRRYPFDNEPADADDYRESESVPACTVRYSARLSWSAPFNALPRCVSVWLKAGMRALLHAA